jgi:hypothetical protein
VRLVDALVDLAESLPEDREPVEDVDLPDALSALQPLIRSWAIADDQQRADEIEAAETDELRSLIAAVEPHLSAIDRLCLQDEAAPAAHATGHLAEATLEARQELERRNA